MSDIVRIWYVSAQRLCNFRCPYCVSIDNYAKSNEVDWLKRADQERFENIVRWIGEQPFRVGVRLATLGEPFASRAFLAQAAWLSTQAHVDFVELLTNGSLLGRVDQLAKDGDLSKISLWVTHHHSEISVDRFIENARAAQERHGCFVVVNGLLFPDNAASIHTLKRAAERAGLRFNLDLGYDPRTPHAAHAALKDMVPSFKTGGLDLSPIIALGADEEMLRLNVSAMGDLAGRLCSAGHNYFYIDILGNVYRCSRYQALNRECVGNVLDGAFQLRLNETPRAPCRAGFGCCNKEDFLNLLPQARQADRTAPSLGWIKSSARSRTESSTQDAGRCA